VLVRTYGETPSALKRNAIHPDVFKDKIQGLHQSDTSYLLYINYQLLCTDYYLFIKY